MERRFAPQKLQVRADGDKRQIAGYAAVHYDGTPATEYELWSDVFERILPGTFDRAVREKDDARALVNHDPRLLLGRVSAGTLSLSVDARGLLYVVDVPDTTAGRDTVESIKRGDLNGSSFAFQVTDESWRKEEGKEIREIRGVILYDVSPVTFPAYDATSAGVRGEGRAARGEGTEARLSYDRWQAAQARADRLKEYRARAEQVAK